MKKARRSIKFVDLLSRSKNVAGLWWLLAKQLVLCLWLTLKLVFAAGRWTTQQLTPVPIPVAKTVRRQTSTGLNVSPVEMTMLTFTLVVIAAQLW